jgi:hypothetical protein
MFSQENFERLIKLMLQQGVCLEAFELLALLRQEEQKTYFDSPICPDCAEETVKTFIQAEDLSGWTACWACECKYDPAVEWNNPVVIVHASATAWKPGVE